MNTPAQNRQRVQAKSNIEGYLEQEKMREGWTLGKPAPKEIRIGELPQSAIPKGDGSEEE